MQIELQIVDFRLQILGTSQEGLAFEWAGNLQFKICNLKSEICDRAHLPLDAIFLTMASTSLRSLSFKLTEYRRIWLKKRTSSSES